MSGLPQGSASGSPNDCLRMGARERPGVGICCSEGCDCSTGGTRGGASCTGGEGSRLVDFGSDTDGMGRSGGLSTGSTRAQSWRWATLTVLALVNAVERDVFALLRQTDQGK
jgi:hypothetical protein